MRLIDKLTEIWAGIDYPFLIHEGEVLLFSQIANQVPIDLSEVSKGDVVAIIGDFNPTSIFSFLRLVYWG